MSKPTKTELDPFMPIADDDLTTVAGGSARVTARSSEANDQMMQLLTQIGSSIKDLARTNQTQSDPSQMMMMMMMMMGGMGGGGGGGSPEAIPINITVRAKKK